MLDKLNSSRFGYVPLLKEAEVDSTGGTVV